MEFLDKLVLPQPEGNLIVLYFLQMVALSALLVYSGILFGSTAFSVWATRKARKDGSRMHSYFAKDMIDLITGNKMFAFGLGVAPFLSVIMIYIQLLQGTGTFVTKYLIFSFLLFVAAIVLIHIYQHSTDLNYIFSLFKNNSDDSSTDKTTADFVEFRKANESRNTRTGFWGLVLLALSLYLFIGSLNLAVENWRWQSADTALEILFSFSAFYKFMQLITASLAVTAIAFLVKKFKWQDEPTFADEEYVAYAKKFNLSVALIFTMALPLFFVLNLVITPKFALNYLMFALAFVGLIMIFVLLHFIYEMVRKNKFVYISAAFYLLIAVIAVSQVKEQMIFKQSNEPQIAQLAANYEVFHTAELAAAGKGGVEISGEDIYKGKCTACHAFDKKVVGPAHRDILPKYIDNPEALAKFILNPVKVDPAFPPMPTQGLKPKEAAAVAKYMIEHYGPELKK